MSEAAEAKRDGAKLQKNSGRGQYQKGDAIWRGFVIDYKEYPKGFRVTMKDWAKLCSDAMAVGSGYFPLFKIIMGTKHRVRLAVLEWAVLTELVDKAEKYDRMMEEKDG